jgi:hypothetical protein
MAALRSVVVTATTTEQSIDVNSYEIKYIANDADGATTTDLYLSFGHPFSYDNYIVVKPQEKRLNYPVNFKTLYYKSSSGSVPFRFECIIA